MFNIRKQDTFVVGKYRSRFIKGDVVLLSIDGRLRVVPLKYQSANLKRSYAYTPASIPARGSSGFNFPNSRKISFDRSSCTFGTTIFTSTI
jgi:hypothetical protein